ncbi:MAG: SMP-30/gluconolactonase/LRE family protein [Verrucomicrobiales bacterium]|nr:SMP-30/gluconolactonase/LRE family protein [Verrucomicrobiales bacterium]
MMPALPLRSFLYLALSSGTFLLQAENDVSVLEAGARPVLLQETGAGEGPVWDGTRGLFTSGDGDIHRRDLSGTGSVYRRGAGTNGLLLDREGRLVMCQNVSRRVVREEKDGTLAVLADSYDGKHFNQPNDLIMDARGRIYFTDPCYGPRDRIEMRDADGREVEGLYRIDPDGTVTRLITHEVDRPNGLALSPDGRFLFVADNNNNTVGGARKLWRFAVLEDGSLDLASRTLLHDWGATRGPDGMKLDVLGRLYVAAGVNQSKPPYEMADEPTAGIYVFTPEGRLLEIIPIPRDETTNCAFGGSDFKTLFVTAGGSLWSLRVHVPGLVSQQR